MSYIGIPPQANFSSGLLDRFTSTTGTTVTLTHDIASENDIVVFVNFVKQDSTTYSVGGTGNKTLTLGGTLVSSDIVEVHYLNIVGQTNAPSSGSVTTATINDTAVTGAKLNADVISSQTELATAPASTDELLISDAGVLKRVDVSLVGGDNAPYFHVKGNKTLTGDNVTQKLDLDTTVVDSASLLDASNDKLVIATAGKYFISYAIGGTISNFADELVTFRGYLYKNGSSFYQAKHSDSGSNPGEANFVSASFVMDLSANDYLELYALSDVSGSHYADCYEHLTGFKIIG